MSFETLNSNIGLVDGPGGKWIKAKVVTNVDPMNLDRIQVSAPGLYDPDLSTVPWVGPLKESPFGFGSGYGTFGTPAVGSDVAILLQDGDPHYPLYMHIQCFPNPGEFPSGTSWGWKDPAGNKFIVQDKDVQFQSAGGLVIHIDPTGDYTLTLPAGKTGTWNVPNAVWNVTNMTVNASTLFKVVGQTNINGVLIDTAGDMTVPGAAVFDALASFMLGVSITGPSTSNGHDIGYLHKHLNGTATGGITGVVTP